MTSAARQARDALIVRLYVEARWRVPHIAALPQVDMTRQGVYYILRRELKAQGRKHLLRAPGTVRYPLVAGLPPTEVPV